MRVAVVVVVAAAVVGDFVVDIVAVFVANTWR